MVFPHSPRGMPGLSLWVLWGRDLEAQQGVQLRPGQKASGTFYSLAPQVTPQQGRVLGVLLRGKPLCLPLKGLRAPKAAGSLLMLIARGIGRLWFKMIFSSFWVELGCWKVLLFKVPSILQNNILKQNSLL